MHRTLDDIGGRYVVVPPEEGVSLATLGVLPYSPPDPAWEDDGRMPAAPDMGAPGISFADWVRTISPAPERGDNSAPFWIPDDPRALAGPSFDDFMRTIDPRANPDLWRDKSAPPYAAWDDSDRYSVPHDPRAAALGAFRIPGLPEDATGWGWHDRSPGRGGDAETPAQLASILERWIGLEMLGADFTPHGRGGYSSISGGGVGGGGSGGGAGGRGGGSSGTGRATGTSGSSDRYIPGADAAGEGPNGPILKGHVYRSGGSNPGSWKAKPGQDHSVRDTPSNPQPATGPVFRDGKKITEVDAAKLPPGSVVRDNNPPGHVSIDGSLLWKLIELAIKKKRP